MNEPADIYNRLHALSESRVRGVADEALSRLTEKARRDLIKILLKYLSAIERLPEAKDSEVALEQRAKRASEADYIRHVID